MKYPLRSIVALLVLAAPGMAQTTDSSQRRAAAAAQDDAPPARPSQQMRRNGGSLLRAQLETTGGVPAEAPSPGRTDYEAASYTAVEAPLPRIIRKHDLVTVIVREQSQFKSEASADLKKDEQLKAAINQFIQANIANVSLDPAIGAVKPTIDLTGSRSWKGDGSIDRKDQFTARVQAEVVDIKPNGNVVLQARTRISTDDEVQTFILSGMIRAQDITPDNTVLSTQMYDLELTKNHEGTVREATRRGWLSRLMDPIWPC